LANLAAYTGHLLRSKGPWQAVERLASITRRLGPTSHKMEHILAEYIDTLRAFESRPTFPTPARIAARHVPAMRRLAAAGVDIAIHGDVHIDYSLCPADKQTAQLQQAAERLREAQIPFSGFRAPYLRWNQATMEAVRRAGLAFDSSLALYWDTALTQPLPPKEEKSWQLLLAFYNPLDANRYPALPFWENGLLRLPVSLPDDEMLLERAGLPDGEGLAAPWLHILAETARQGGLFVLQLHPERFLTAAGALRLVLTAAQTYRPAIWLATLAEITAWWQRREKATFQVEPVGDGWQVTAQAEDDVTIFGRNVATNVPQEAWADGWHAVEAQSFRVTGPARPTIGVSKTAPPALVAFLREQGYWLETATSAHQLVLGDTYFAAADRLPLLRKIEAADTPLLRFGRWPRRFHSALAVSGDLDSFTWWDYFDRVGAGCSHD